MIKIKNDVVIATYREISLKKISTGNLLAIS